VLARSGWRWMVLRRVRWVVCWLPNRGSRNSDASPPARGCGWGGHSRRRGPSAAPCPRGPASSASRHTRAQEIQNHRVLARKLGDEQVVLERPAPVVAEVRRGVGGGVALALAHTATGMWHVLRTRGCGRHIAVQGMKQSHVFNCTTSLSGHAWRAHSTGRRTTAR